MSVPSGRRVVFLTHPQTVKSGSDCVSMRGVNEFHKHGINATLIDLWPDPMARLLLKRQSRLGYLLFKFCGSPAFTKLALRKINKSDIVWMYDISLFGNIHSTSFERRIRQNGASYVFHLHDDWLSVDGYRKAALDRIEIADLVGGLTPGICSSIKNAQPDSKPELLRGPIDVFRLKPSIEKSKTIKPSVVWTGNPQNLKEIPDAMDILSRVYSRAPFDFRIISGNTKPVLNLPIPWEWLPYDAAKETERISGACAGLAPLEDRPYARCKDVFKVKTYMACGVAPIASAIGNNLEVIRDGETGFLVKTRDEWEARLLELVSSLEKSAAMGAAARADCVQRFSHAAIIPEWIGTLEQRFGALRSGG